jgi:hypothetical protein
MDNEIGQVERGLERWTISCRSAGVATALGPHDMIADGIMILGSARLPGSASADTPAGEIPAFT